MTSNMPCRREGLLAFVKKADAKQRRKFVTHILMCESEFIQVKDVHTKPIARVANV